MGLEMGKWRWETKTVRCEHHHGVPLSGCPATGSGSPARRGCDGINKGGENVTRQAPSALFFFESVPFVAGCGDVSLLPTPD